MSPKGKLVNGQRQYGKPMLVLQFFSKSKIYYTHTHTWYISKYIQRYFKELKENGIQRFVLAHFFFHSRSFSMHIRNIPKTPHITYKTAKTLKSLYI